MQKNVSIRILSVAFLCLWLLTLPLVAGASNHTNNSYLEIGKTHYAPGEEIRLNFHASGNWPSDAWIGIIPSNVQHGNEAINDQYDITYQYIDKRTHGVMIFNAPSSGQWDLRMHDTDSNGREIAFVSFTVGDVSPQPHHDLSLSLEKTTFAPGEKIQLHFSASSNWPSDAWIGIIPSNVQHGNEAINDQYDITYQYIDKRTHGVMVFTAPGSGQWDLRMHDTDNNGREITYVSFTVR